MNKVFKKIVCGALSVSTLFGVGAAAACGGNSGTGTGNSGNVTDYTHTSKWEGGTHQFNVTATDKVFFKNGATEYSVLIASGASSKIEAAALDFAAVFEEATGIAMPIVRDGSKTYSDSAKYVVFGNCAFTEGSGAKKPAMLKNNGYVIQTKGNSIIVLGGGDLGTQFGAYGLLNQLFRYEYYFADSFGNECYYVDKNVKEMNLPNFDVFDNPDFDHAIAGYAPMFTNADKAHKMRMETQGEVYITGAGTSYVHNTLQYLPKEKYQADHEEWYALNNVQLCYTARGDAEEYQALVDELSTVLIKAIADSPEKEIITLTHMDDGYWCTCDVCSGLLQKYGTDAASCIMLTNDVADKIEAWRQENAPERKITLAMFAYTSTETPPAKKNADGTWSAIDDEVKLHDNVCLYYAPIYSVSFNKPMDAEANKQAEDQIRGWEACAKHISIWSYSSFFTDYFLPYDTFAANQNQYKRWLDAGGIWIFDNTQYNTKAALSFSCLKAYLNSVWSWDVNRNFNELVDGFFANYFGSANGAMRKYFDELRVWLTALGQGENGLHGITGTTMDDWGLAVHWPENLLTKWLGYIDEAKKEAEAYKATDPALYELIINRITLEGLTPRYMLLQYHSATHFTANGLTAEKSAFAKDCRRLGVTKWGEGQDIELLIGEW